MLLGYIIVMFQSGSFRTNQILICVIWQTQPFQYRFHLQNFRQFSATEIPFFRTVTHTARANTSRAVLPSTIKPVKSYKIHLLFS